MTTRPRRRGGAVTLDLRCERDLPELASPMTQVQSPSGTANLQVKRHGEDAPIHAAMRADAMLEATH